ncbi:MAG: hypothetical protein E6X12_04690 [Actinomyces sp.]|nr:hypothetical protein [Actinomyces sp.]
MSKTAAEIEKDLAAKNSEARALRRALREARKRELVSAKIALGEALSRVLFADTPEAMQVLVQTLNEGGIDEEVRRVFSANRIGNDAPEEHEEEPRWGSDEGDDQP